MARMPRAITFDDLYIGRGTLDMGFHPQLDALDGSPVVVSGVVAPSHDHDDHDDHQGQRDHRHGERSKPAPLILMDDSGQCPDCAPVPVATIQVEGLPNLPAGCVPGRTVLTVAGRLEYGYAVDSTGHASFVRVIGASLIGPDQAPA